MKNGTKLVMVAVALVLVGVIWLIQTRSGSEQSHDAPDRSGAEIAPAQHPKTVAERLRSEFEALNLGDAAPSNKILLNDLRRFLLAQPAAEARWAIVNFLDGGSDTSTGLEFKIGRNRSLDEASSFRVFLLDVLAEIDPAAAAVYAEALLQTKDSADEWAISLRNYAQGNQTPEGNNYLERKVRELVGHEPWLEAPSTGFLESFDVFVYTGSTASTPLLSKLATRGAANSKPDAVAFAAFLTLDRLTQSKPETMLEALGTESDLLTQRGSMVSNFFARADVRDPEQRTYLEAYLLDPARSQKELESFAGVYPNNNRMISNNLLTTNQTPAGADLIAHDREALAIVETWSEDPKFDRIRPHVEKMTHRLQAFVRQASQENQ